ncbi:hypothetical protein BJ742DRAFT_64285 [Cladochytrium replicatum]|nr:hypothetical protein BJ742DRAFT_64285 [Cladochytrium replicatum]
MLLLYKNTTRSKLLNRRLAHQSRMASSHQLLIAFLAVAGSLDGADKIYRLLLYSLRTEIATLRLLRRLNRHPQQHGFISRKLASLAERLDSLVDPILTTRMTLRFLSSVVLLDRLVAIINMWKEPRVRHRHIPDGNGLETQSGDEANDTDNDAFEERIERLIQIGQIGALFLLYPMEHVYYLSFHGVLRWKSLRTVQRWSRISSFGWFSYLLLELILKVRQVQSMTSQISVIRKQIHRLKYKEAWSREVVSAASGSIPLDVLMTYAGPIQPTSPSTEGGPPPLIVDTSLEQASLKRDLGMLVQSRREVRWRLLSLFCDIPIAVHWTLEKPILHPLVLGILGTVSSYWSLRTLIVNALNDGDARN